jgi:hypothetical protein
VINLKPQFDLGAEKIKALDFLRKNKHLVFLTLILLKNENDFVKLGKLEGIRK